MKCPGCGVEISKFDLSPNCKKCGVHIMYYTQEEDLKRDAKKTELEFASARLLAAKLKTAFIKGKIPVLRTVFMLLTILSLLLPTYNLKLSFPWWEYELSVGALGIYNVISDSFWQIFDSLINVGLSNSLAVTVILSYALLLLCAVFVLILAVIWLLSFINVKKTARVSVFFCVMGIISQLASTAVSFIVINMTGVYENVTATPLFGGIVGIVILGALLATNLILSVTETELPLKEADRKRLEIKAMLKKGEISLDELPLPIVQDEEKTEKETKEKTRGKDR